jgi:hypothetical protein
LFKFMKSCSVLPCQCVSNPEWQGTIQGCDQ